MRFYNHFFIFIILSLSIPFAFAGSPVINPVINIGAYRTGINPALETLITTELAHKKYKDTLTLLEEELKKDPNNVTLLYKKASIYADLSKFQNSLATLDEIQRLAPEDKEANDLRKKIVKFIAETPYNEIGIDWDEAYISDLKDFWIYSSVHYYRLNDNIKYGGHIYYANRNGSGEEQFQLEAYPQFTQHITASLTFAVAKTTQILFPAYQYNLEGYFDIANGFGVSVGQSGQRFVQLSNQKIYTYTASLNQYTGKYFFWFRPYYYTPINSALYTIGARKYFSDENNYINFRIGAGKVPDIGDVAPLDQILTVNQKFGAGIDGEVSLTKRLFLKYGVGYVKLTYPSGLLREITDASLGIVGLF
ncbi:MAG TPA: YaiO family outer membrane beta-barrel protein [Gammaproteobacteria bacterium]|nr:YaiO family outer membrane beta-barrel protein [Gammaproteobacteria bacterium]